MKLKTRTHNIRGLNDPINNLKYKKFHRSISPRVDVFLLQEHKLTWTKLEHLDKRLMPWILEVETCYKNWFNYNGARKGGACILLASKYVILVTSTGFIMNNRVIHVKMDGIGGGRSSIAYIYAPNRSILWQEMAKSLPKDCCWDLGGDLNMSERPEDKLHDCGKTINDLERFSYNSLMDALQLHDSFQLRRGLRFSWDNQQQGLEHWLARLDRIYTPKDKREDLSLVAYTIHGDSLGSYHSLVQI